MKNIIFAALLALIALTACDDGQMKGIANNKYAPF